MRTAIVSAMACIGMFDIVVYGSDFEVAEPRALARCLNLRGEVGSFTQRGDVETN